ncbi:MAG: TAXI family TRAP transporter solute-binding subunit [Clostridia bacterium]|nr:TAXI family TRAP transporter solute-binding subunit [Clostridia bacterium]
MSKFKTAIIIIIIVSLMGITGCQIANGDNISDTSKAPVKASIAYGSPGGLWFMLCSGISESVNKTYPGSNLELSPGGNFPNLSRINEGTLDFGLTLTNMTYEGYNGIGQIDEKMTNIGGIAVFYPSTFQLLFRKKLGITSFEQILENKIAVNMSIGEPGGNSAEVLGYVLSEYDLTIKDLENWGCKFYEKRLSETEEMFSDGVIDGIWYIAGAPTPVFAQIGTNEELVVLELPLNILKTLVDDYGYNNYVLPGNSYSFKQEDYTTVCSYTMLTASLSVSDETAYKVAKSITENVDYIGSIHASLKGLTSESILAGMPVPLHPGAEKYYKEIGLID